MRPFRYDLRGEVHELLHAAALEVSKAGKVVSGFQRVSRALVVAVQHGESEELHHFRRGSVGLTMQAVRPTSDRRDLARIRKGFR